MRVTIYQAAVLSLYVVFVTYCVVRAPSFLDYSYSYEGFGEVFAIAAGTLIAFSIYIRFTSHARWTLPAAAATLIYGAVFAIPEEMLFRGVIQNAIQAHATDCIAIALSSVIFGAAHLPNGASGWRPHQWNWRFAGLAALGGVPLGALYAITGSLLVPTVVHAVLAAGMSRVE